MGWWLSGFRGIRKGGFSRKFGEDEGEKEVKAGAEETRVAMSQLMGVSLLRRDIVGGSSLGKNE